MMYFTSIVFRLSDANQKLTLFHNWHVLRTRKDARLCSHLSEAKTTHATSELFKWLIYDPQQQRSLLLHLPSSSQPKSALDAAVALREGPGQPPQPPGPHRPLQRVAHEHESLPVRRVEVRRSVTRVFGTTHLVSANVLDERDLAAHPT